MNQINLEKSRIEHRKAVLQVARRNPQKEIKIFKRMESDLVRNRDSTKTKSEFTNWSILKSQISGRTVGPGHAKSVVMPSRDTRVRSPNKRAKAAKTDVFSSHARKIRSINRSYSKKNKSKSALDHSPQASIRSRITSKFRKYQKKRASHTNKSPHRSVYHRVSSPVISQKGNQSMITGLLENKPRQGLFRRLEQDRESRLSKRLQRKLRSSKNAKDTLFRAQTTKSTKEQGNRRIDELLVERRKEFIREQMLKGVRSPSASSHSPASRSEAKTPICIDEPNDDSDEDYFAQNSRDSEIKSKFFGSDELSQRFTNQLEKKLALIRQKMTNKDFFKNSGDSDLSN